MDQGPLVIEQTDAGTEFVNRLRKHFGVAAAFWIRATEDGPWYLYVVSPEVNDANIDVAYGTVLQVTASMSAPKIDPFRVRLIGMNDSIAKDVLEIQRCYPGKIPTRVRRPLLGGAAIEEAYIYPPLEPEVKGFDEIKRRFPSAEIFSNTVSFKALSAPALRPCMGKINDAEFEGKAPGTLLFMGPSGSSEGPVAKLVFVYRPEGWNKLFRAETQTWEEVRHATTGQPLYQSADFSPLAAMKVQG